MSRYDDYEAEMALATLSDLEMERLLSGMTPENDEAAQLVALLDLIRAEGDRSPSEGAVVRVANQAASLTRAAPTVGVPTRPSGRIAVWRLRPQIAVVVGAIVVIGAFSGVAVAADGAVPGDVLYGIDRALEKIGIGAGAAEERLEEARRLLSEGESSEALRHATEVLTEGEDGPAAGDARAALEDAAVTVDMTISRRALRPGKMSTISSTSGANHGNDVGADGASSGPTWYITSTQEAMAGLPPTRGRTDNGNGNGGPSSSNPGRNSPRLARRSVQPPQALRPGPGAPLSAPIGSRSHRCRRYPASAP